MVFLEAERERLKAHLQTEAMDWNAIYGQLMDHASAVADAMDDGDKKKAAKFARSAVASAKLLQRAVAK